VDGSASYTLSAGASQPGGANSFYKWVSDTKALLYVDSSGGGVGFGARPPRHDLALVDTAGHTLTNLWPFTFTAADYDPVENYLLISSPGDAWSDGSYQPPATYRVELRSNAVSTVAPYMLDLHYLGWFDAAFAGLDILGQDGPVCFYPNSQGANCYENTYLNSALTGLSPSPDRKYLVAYGNLGGGLITGLFEHADPFFTQGGVYELTWSPDSQFFYFQSGGAYYLYDVADQTKQILPVPANYIDSGWQENPSLVPPTDWTAIIGHDGPGCGCFP
jgi:hypothetical protein